VSIKGDSELIPGSTRTLTFLATDLKDSTELFNQFPDEMFAFMERHDDLLNQVIRGSGGEVFKFTGDGVFAVFDEPASAVVAALDIQRGMLRLDHDFTDALELRIGVNTGPSRQRGADYFGPALNTAARLEGAANGRQVLVSQSTRQHLGEPEDIVFTDLGIHRFKGLKPIQVFQASAPGLPGHFPPIGGKRDAPDGNLPASLSSFLGRTSELTGIRRRIHEGRIVTLLGPGGIGKTRLALEAARTLRDDFDGGVWLVELSPIDQGGDVWPSFATALSIAPLPGASPRVQVLDRLRDADALLVIDNCEHVLGEVASAAVDIASTAQGVRMLTTSRRVLGVGGESIFDVAPLDEDTTETGVTSPAVSLFVERAQLASRNFDPTESDLQIVAAICADLDYLPLAIEIAAAQLRRLTLSQIHAKSSDPLALGSKNYHRAIGRQQTIRETLEWSYGLLDDTSAQVLDTLSVLSGSFVEEVGRDLCAFVGIDEDDYVESLGELVDSSLLARDPSDALRFKILHLVRAFGRGRLVQDGRYEHVERLHGLTFARRIAQLGAQFSSPEEGVAAAAIFTELPDMRAAFERAIIQDLELASDLTAPLFFFSYVHRGAECGTWPARVMEQPGADELAAAPIILAAAACHALHADGQPVRAKEYIERARTAEDRGAESSRGWVDGVAGMVALWTGDLTGSIDLHRRATRIAHERGNSGCEVISWSLAAYAAYMAKDPELASALLAEAAKASETTGSVTAIGYVSFTRGRLEARRNPDLALEVLESSAEWAADAGNSQGFNRVRRHIADIRAAQAAPAERLRIRAEGFLGLPESGDTLHGWSAAESLLKSLAEDERYNDVALFAGALATSPIKIEPSVARVVDDARERLGTTTFERVAAEGSQLGLSQLRRYVEANYLDGRG
jgi:predicted ATPase/class 3 adenylate cyclase